MKRHDELFKKMFDRDDERISFEKNYLNETISEKIFYFFFNFFK